MAHLLDQAVAITRPIQKEFFRDDAGLVEGGLVSLGGGGIVCSCLVLVVVVARVPGWVRLVGRNFFGFYFCVSVQNSSKGKQVKDLCAKSVIYILHYVNSVTKTKTPRLSTASGYALQKFQTKVFCFV